jgi:hypothetical protein
VNWIGFAVEHGVNDVGFSIFSGRFMAALRDPNDFEKTSDG